MPNILLVDDHSIVRTGLKLLIQDFLPHTTIDEAHDGDSAFQKIKQKNYDMVVMDVGRERHFELRTLRLVKKESP